MVLLMLAWRGLPKRRRALGRSAMVVIAALIAILPFAVSRPAALSGRGAVWRGSLNALSDRGSLLFGLGPYWGGSGTASSYRGVGSETTSGHNLFVQWLVTGGLIQVSIGILILFLVAKRALDLDSGSRTPVFTGFTTAFLAISISEFIAIFSASSQLFVLTAMPLAVILACERRSRETLQPDVNATIVRSAVVDRSIFLTSKTFAGEVIAPSSRRR